MKDFYEVVIYGGTAAGVTAAIQVARMGCSVALVSPETHLGGLTTSGLGWTDSKNGDAIGGLARVLSSYLACLPPAEKMDAANARFLFGAEGAGAARHGHRGRQTGDVDV